MKYITVTPGSIPGVEIHDGAAFCEVAGKEYPVIAVIEDEKLGYLPVVDLPQMSDEQWDKLTREKKEAAQRADDTESGKVKKVLETAYFTANDTTGMEGLQE